MVRSAGSGTALIDGAEADAGDEMTDCSVLPKMVERRVVTAAVPLILYTATGFMVFPLLQSLIYTKVCLRRYVDDLELCSNRSLTGKVQIIQQGSNYVLLWNTVAMTVLALFTAPMIGAFSDRCSRKLAMIRHYWSCQLRFRCTQMCTPFQIPFVGVVFEDLFLIVQSQFIAETSPMWLVASEGFFGLFGGYMSIFGTIFAYVAHVSEEPTSRSKNMGVLEGCMGLGGVIGYYSTGILKHLLGYTGLFVLIAAVHTFCLLFILVVISDIRPAPSETASTNRTGSMFAEILINALAYFKAASTLFCKRRSGRSRQILLLVLAAFSLSYFVYQGSLHILLYYLKFRYFWDAGMFGYLKGTIHLAGTVMTLLVYPALKQWNVRDTRLALVGLLSRLLGRAVLASVWAPWSVFLGTTLFFARTGGGAKCDFSRSVRYVQPLGSRRIAITVVTTGGEQRTRSCVVLTSFKLFSQPIECSEPEPRPHSSFQDYTENYCWAQDTYFLPFDEQVPKEVRDREDKQISYYYQWVPFFLLIEAACFRLPSLIWQYLAHHSGIKIHDIVKLAVDPQNVDPEVKKSNIASLTVHLQNALRFHRRVNRKQIMPHKILRFLNIPYSAFFVTTMYLVTKLAYILNVAVQLYLMNRFLETDKYTWYGFGALRDLMNGSEWQTTGTFPRVTICDFQVRVMGNVQRYSVQCVLVINIFNEKIFIFLWFWYVILFVLTSISFVYFNLV